MLISKEMNKQKPKWLILRKLAIIVKDIRLKADFCCC